MNHRPGALKLRDPEERIQFHVRMLNASWCGLSSSYRDRFFLDLETGHICDAVFGLELDLVAAKELLVNGFGWNPDYVASL